MNKEREELRKRVEAAVFTAFEAGWFDNKGLLGVAWKAAKDELCAPLLALLGEQEPVAWMVVSHLDGKLSSTWFAQPRATREEAEEDRREIMARYTDDPFTYTVEPVGVSPVASAPEEEREAINELRSALEGAVEALRLTREYVGEEKLPALPGWSWHDATVRANHVLARLRVTPTEEQERRAPESEEGGNE